MDPLQWMGAVRIRVQTADKASQQVNPQLIHMTLNNILWSEKLINKSLIHFLLQIIGSGP